MRLEDRFKSTWQERVSKVYKPRRLKPEAKKAKPVFSLQNELSRTVPERCWFWSQWSNIYTYEYTASFSDYNRFHNMIYIKNGEFYRVNVLIYAQVILLEPLDIFVPGDDT
jgi:hypothetical protein